MATPEGNIQSAICDYLSKRQKILGFVFWRNNTVVIYDPVGKKFRSMPKYSVSGQPDIVVIHNGFYIGLEVKTKKTKQSQNQKDFEKLIKDAGGEYYVVRNIKDVQEIGL